MLRVALAVSFTVIAVGAGVVLREERADTQELRETLTFDTLPPAPWYQISDGGTATVEDGVMTLDVPQGFFHEFTLEGRNPPVGMWNASVSNERGWVVEARLRVDPSSEPACETVTESGAGVTLWMNDFVNFMRLAFSPDTMCLLWTLNDKVDVPMDTTDAFHTYRVESRLKNVKVYVDGALVIDEEMGETESTTPGLLFGDGNVGGGPSLSYWDELTYDVTGLVTAPTATPSAQASPTAVATPAPTATTSGVVTPPDTGSAGLRAER